MKCNTVKAIAHEERGCCASYSNCASTYSNCASAKSNYCSQFSRPYFPLLLFIHEEHVNELY